MAATSAFRLVAGVFFVLIVAKAQADAAWLKNVAALPAERQVEAVTVKLKELNPGFDGKETHKIDGGVVTELLFMTYDVTDISPVRALPGLRSLKCSSSFEKRGKLSDLSPLKAMKLTHLACYGTNVSDLSPLKDMKLTALSCGGTKVSDLSPLKDMKLTLLDCKRTQVSDLSPLKNMLLTSLACDDTKVSDLSPLKNMKLAWLTIRGTQVIDLSPLRDMKLKFLVCTGTKVTDLSPLKRMPLTAIQCDFKKERDTEILQSIKTLESINGKPVKDFWQEVREKQP